MKDTNVQLAIGNIAMYSEIINLSIQGIEFECQVEFEFTRGEPQIIRPNPNDCQEGSPDEFSITNAYWVDDGKFYPLPNYQLEQLNDLIIIELELLRDEM